jgi:hypothetical protein
MVYCTLHDSLEIDHFSKVPYKGSTMFQAPIADPSILASNELRSASEVWQPCRGLGDKRA